MAQSCRSILTSQGRAPSTQAVELQGAVGGGWEELVAGGAQDTVYSGNDPTLGWSKTERNKKPQLPDFAACTECRGSEK